MQNMEFIKIMGEKKTKLIFTRYPNLKIDGSIQNEMLLFFHSIFSRMGRKLISERTKSALTARKTKGLYIK